MKRRLLVFGGTTEGREISLLAEELGYEVTVCVATDYGEMQMEKRANLKVLTGRLDENGISELISKEGFTTLIDATHPYALEASRNILKACEKTGCRRLRLLRGESGLDRCECFDSLEEACKKAAKAEGSILAVTGSKELLPYTEIPNWRSRVFFRVLPAEASMALCRQAGIPEGNIIAAKGPFSKEENLSILRKYDIKIIITKDGGTAGGFDAKVSAASEHGARVFAVRRPKEQGQSFSELTGILKEGL